MGISARPSRSTRRLHLWLVCLVVSLCFAAAAGRPALARPAGTSSQSTEQAKQEVLTALSVGNPGHAEEILDRTFRADPDPILLYHLGLVAQAQGRAVAALDLFRRYQELVGTAVSPETNKAIEHFASGLTASITVLNVSAESGMLLCVDDQIVGMLPLRTPLLIAGGMHRFRIERRGEVFESGKLAIPDGREADLRLTPGAKGTAVALLSLSPVTMFALDKDSSAAASAPAVQAALTAAARANHLAPLPQGRLALLLSKRAADCLDQPDCRFAVAEQVQARSVLLVAVKEKDKESAPASCSIQIDYLDVNAGQVAASGTTEATPCDAPALTEALSKGLQQLLSEANARPRGMVSISSVPEGAQVRVDGLLRGVTPYLRASFSGSHEILVEQESFNPFRSRIEVVSGQVAAVQAALVALPPQKIAPAPKPAVVPPQSIVWIERHRPRPRWRLALGGIAGGTGLLIASFGLSALALNGRCAEQPVEGAICDVHYSTNKAGIGLLGTGLGLSLAGAVLLLVPGQKERVRAPAAGASGPARGTAAH